MADTYKNYKELCEVEAINIDYRIKFKEKTLIMTLHGGGIEPGSSEIVEEISKDKYEYYIFEGIKSSGNSKLHITSTNFDEPNALAIVKNSHRTVAIHGTSGTDAVTHIGGLDDDLRIKIANNLKEAGFKVNLQPDSSISGMNINNIVNKNFIGKGVQLELSQSLRKSFFKKNDYSASNRVNKTQKFYDYCNAIRNALA